MASLTGTKIKDTYDGLLKTTDNGVLGASAKLITDGLGNSSGVYLGTSGNVGVGISPSAKLDVASAGNLVSTGVFTNPHLALRLNAAPVDNDSFTGMTFALSDSANYGYSLGAKRESGGNGFLEIRQHFNSATGTHIASFTGNGLTFNGDTSSANALDDYEEGTWTPVIRGSGTAGTYELSGAVGNYTKIGRQVTLNCLVITDTVTGGGSGYVQITGLPFTNSSQSFGSVFLNSIDFTGNYVIVGFISSSGANSVYLSEIVDNGSAIDLPISAIGNGDTINFTLTYFTS